MGKESIDEKDKKILFEMDFDARDSSSKIGRKIRMSPQVVDYRIKKMESSGVIRSYYPITHMRKLNHVYGRIFLNLHNTNKEEEEQIIYEITQNPEVSWVVRCSGNYKLLIGIWSKNLTEFKDVSMGISTKYGKYIKGKKESIGISISHFQNRYLVKSKSSRNVEISQETIQEIDDLDKKILKKLAYNARLPTTDIAKSVNESVKTVSNRIKSLEKKGVILGYRPEINVKKLGLTHFKVLFFLTNLQEAEYKRFYQYLKQNQNVIFIIKEVGICDLDMEAVFESIEEFMGFMEKLNFEFSEIIKDYEMLILKDTLKIEYLPF